MQKHEKIAVEAAKEVAAAYGLVVEAHVGGRHPHLIFRSDDGWSKELPIPSSPRSDEICQRNFARQKARRVGEEYKRSRANDNHPKK